MSITNTRSYKFPPRWGGRYLYGNKNVKLRTFYSAFCADFLDKYVISKILHHISFALVNLGFTLLLVNLNSIKKLS